MESMLFVYSQCKAIFFSTISFQATPYNGVDAVSISNRLGHAQPSIAANIYAHVIENSDEKNAEILSDIFLKNAQLMACHLDTAAYTNCNSLKGQKNIALNKQTLKPLEL